jgi:hypothetical protein
MNGSDVRKAVFDYLAADAALLAMLPPNLNWSSRRGAKIPENSFLPVNQLDPKLFAFPLITLQMGNEVSAGGSNNKGRFYSQLVYVRCYNATDKAFVEITDILSRVAVLLHNHSFTLEHSVHVQTSYQTMMPELVDQGYNLPYREAQFQMMRLA